MDDYFLWKGGVTRGFGERHQSWKNPVVDDWCTLIVIKNWHHGTLSKSTAAQSLPANVARCRYLLYTIRDQKIDTPPWSRVCGSRLHEWGRYNRWRCVNIVKVKYPQCSHIVTYYSHVTHKPQWLHKDNGVLCHRPGKYTVIIKAIHNRVFITHNFQIWM